ncbi:unnamed protein product [Prorocentrum cordatum]|uniref:GST N-terminal domain-containing protein n=1 Tax=Prorocentrum cordatum TaxID=2364126 RepID=A0ABN9PRF0_9DINO|nr:unnamed protein product [Polarella glacialis]
MGCLGCLEGLGLGGKRPPPLPRGPMTLKYFPFTGRAEPIRLALRIGGIEFQDQRITNIEWATAAKQTTPYGQVPVLVVEQTQIAQTKNILRYLGKLIKHDGRLLYPEDPLVAAKVDEVLDAFDDVWVLLAPTYPESRTRSRGSWRGRNSSGPAARPPPCSASSRGCSRTAATASWCPRRRG